MAVTILTQSARGRKRSRFGGGTILTGVAAFSTTDATGYLSSAELPKYVESVQLTIIGAPGSQAGNLDLQVNSLATLSATTTFLYRVPKAGTITGIKFTVDTTVATDDTNYWSIGVVNQTGPVTLVDTTAAANTNKVTGGSAFTADTPRSLTLAASAVAAGDVLEVTMTKTASAAALVEFQMDVQMTTTDVVGIEQVYLNESATPDSTTGAFATPTVSGSRALAIGRVGPASGLTSGLKFFFRVEGT